MHLIQAGVNLIYIRANLLGHADVATTEVYARADAETKRKAIENAYEPLTPDALPDWTRGPVPDRLARRARTLTPTRHVMRTRATPNSGRYQPKTDQTGRITPASTKWRKIVDESAHARAREGGLEALAAVRERSSGTRRCGGGRTPGPRRPG